MLRPLPIVLLSAVAVLAQTAQITGRITDASSAIVAGAKVSAANEATGLGWDAATNDSGYFTMPALPPGTYRIAVQAPGFKPVTRSGVLLEIGQIVRLDFALEIGSLAEQVTVTGEVPRVQTEQATLGTVVERQRIEELPLNGRHVFTLVKIVAGVHQRFDNLDGFGEIRNQDFSQMRFNGGPWGGNQFYLDGAMNTLPVSNEISVVPMVDAIEEFKVETNGLKAEYGQTSGGAVAVATKSGTNQLHGSLYEFMRNDALNARNAFATQRDPFTGKIKPILRYNQYGGTAGGPVRLPRLYDGRNRTFFFFGYEQWKHRASRFSRGTVPVDRERSGDFSQTRDGRGTLIPIYDPATTRGNPAGAGFVRDLFPGNVVPRARFDALSQRVLELMPRPNAVPDNPFTNTNNYLSLASSPTDQGVTNLRLDHRFSDKDSVFFRYSGTRNTFDDRGFGLGAADSLARIDQRDNHNWLFNHTRIVTPTALNEFRAGVTRQYLDFRHPSVGEDWPRKLGFPPIIPPDQFPIVAIANFMPLSRAGFAGGFRAQHTVQFVDNLAMTRGKHQFKMGVDHRILRQNWLNKSDPSGRFDFGADLTNNPLAPAGTGWGMATFLLGEVSGGRLRTLPHFSFHSWNTGLYIQDDYRVTPRLTLNLGLRYDVNSGPVERFDRYSTFDPYLLNSTTGRAGVMRYAGVNMPRQFVSPDRNDFGPRFGFAWDVFGNGRTALRGGYGVVYMMTDASDVRGDNPSALGFAADTNFIPPTLGPFRAFQFNQGPPQLVLPLGAQGGPSAFRGQSLTYQDQNPPTPYLQQWNFTIQQQIPARFVVTASYAGNRGIKLFGAGYNVNQLNPSFLSLGLALQDQLPNPFFGQIGAGGISGRTLPRSQLLRPLPDYLELDIWQNRGAASTYHSVQLSLERRFANGLSLLMSYTNGKLINDATSTATTGGGEKRLPRRPLQPPPRALGRSRGYLPALGHQRRLRVAFQAAQSAAARRQRMADQRHYDVADRSSAASPRRRQPQRHQLARRHRRSHAAFRRTHRAALVQYRRLPQSAQLRHRQRRPHTARHPGPRPVRHRALGVQELQHSRARAAGVSCRSLQRHQRGQLQRSQHNVPPQRPGTERQPRLWPHHQRAQRTRAAVRPEAGILRSMPMRPLAIVLLAASAALAADPVERWAGDVRVGPLIPGAPRHMIHTYFNVSPESPDGKWVLYYASSMREGYRGEVRIYERATGKERVLARDITTEDAHRAACQQWISNGKRVVYHDYRGGQWMVAVVDLDTGSERILARDRLVSWGAPDGDLVPIYGRHWDPGPHRDLELLNVSTGAITRIVTAAEVKAAYPELIAKEFGDKPISIFFPILSPDRQRIFFKIATPTGKDFRSKDASHREQIYVYDIARKRFLFGDRRWGHPFWLPDSRTILNTPNMVWDSDTGQARPIPDLPKFPGSHPSVSPDSTLLATDYTTGVPGEWAVAVGSMRGGRSQELHRFDNSKGANSWRVSHPHPVFSPDGRRVYFNVNDGPWTRLFVAEAK